MRVRSIGILLVAIVVLASAPIAVAGDVGPRDETEGALKNAATAEESFRTGHPHYTTKVWQLKREGLRYDEKAIDLFVSWADERGYCIEARHNDLAKARHYDSDDGRPFAGRCRSRREARTNWREQVDGTMKNAATAEEAYQVDNGSYTTRKSDLQAQGWNKESRAVHMVIVSADDAGYCFEATHDRLKATHRYSSNEGVPKKGRCEG
jgi:hypothetical protein